jgi:hypothetical protein
LQHLGLVNGPASCSHKQIKGVNEKRIEWGKEVKLWRRLLRRIDKSLPEVLANGADFLPCTHWAKQLEGDIAKDPGGHGRVLLTISEHSFLNQ